MAVSDSAYESQFMIPSPKGIFQAAGDTNINADYAYSAYNIRTERGLLASAYGTSMAFPPVGEPIETLARFYRRTQPNAPEVFVAAAGGAVYTIVTGEEEWTKRMDGFFSNSWSSVTYESSQDGLTIDVLIMSNPKDGMIVVFGDDLRVEKKSLSIGDEYANVKFAVLGRYAERIWGIGAEGYPDSIFYSKPYNPFDWNTIPETPEIGGGMINQPTWDGDSFVSLNTFGNYLLASKSTTVFEVRGTDPSNFTINEAYGTDGPVRAQTLCTDRGSAFFLTMRDIGLYDGSTLRLLSRDALYELMNMIDQNSEKTACAVMNDHIYYLALCIKSATDDVIQENNSVIEYDTERGTFMLRNGIRPKYMFALNGKIYFTDAEPPYNVMVYNDHASSVYADEAISSYWETPWLDLGKSYIKRDFDIRFTADADGYDTPIEISVETEKRKKKKIILLQKMRKDYRVKLHVHGLRVKVRVQSAGSKYGWRIYGGLQVRYSLDEQ